MAEIILEWRYYHEESSNIFSSHWFNYDSDGSSSGTSNTLGHYLDSGYQIKGQSSCLGPNGATIVTWVLSL